MTDHLIQSVFKLGDMAPDATLLNTDGKIVNLSAVWSSFDGDTVLVFLRHFGCIFCRQHAKELSASAERIRLAGGQVVLIGMETPQEAAEFARNQDVPFPVLSDADRSAYRAYGLPEGSIGQLAGPKVVAASLRAVANGAGVGKAVGNRRQLPGTYIVDNAGVIRFAKPAAHAGDVATVLEILHQLGNRIESPGVAA
ncbi:hypothetical protein BH23CHL5_BH23CHL5_07920 [soil metagenome]